jgi:adenine-specific DNA-methyltransferase
LDFFAGSCTTAQAVLELNHEDNGNRRFIMVQLPEPTNNPDYPTIGDIGKERIRRVIAQMRQADKGKFDLHPDEDLGFRVFNLTESNFRPWKGVDETTPEAYTQQMALFTDPLVDGWKVEPVIFEAALKEGYGLACRVKPLSHRAGNTLYRVTGPDKEQSFTICLDATIQSETVRALTLDKDDLFICRDIALDDETAANLALQCRLKTI